MKGAAGMGVDVFVWVVVWAGIMCVYGIVWVVVLGWVFHVIKVGVLGLALLVGESGY